jgi:very-short-patch-repair endonuclease
VGDVCSISRPSDADLARLAGRLRVLTLAQLIAAGLTPEAIEHRVRHGRLQHLWTGVYLAGPNPPHPLSLAHGAVVSCTSSAWVSHRWAPYVLGFASVPGLPVDVTVTAGSRRGRPGFVKVHHCSLLEPRDTTTRHGIPVTTAARAILDIAETATSAELETLIADAQVKGVMTERHLRDVLSRAGRRRGANKLRRILTDAPGRTLSEAERILRRLLRQAGLPQPLTDHAIGRYRADFAWPDHRLIVEYDGFRTHAHRRAFHHDRRRNAELTAKGWSVMQVTADQLENEPFAVVARIAEALARRAA